jgi:AraC family transcriptional regulator
LRPAIAALALLAGTSATAGADEGVVASANGGYGFSGPVLGGFIDVHPFAWNVEVRADGSVQGRYNYTQVRDGVELTVKGSLTCAVIEGNQVWAVGDFALQRLRFPAGHRIAWFEPEWGYVALVLDGALTKSFSSSTCSLRRDSLATLPAGAGHRTDFGVTTTHVLTLYPRSDESQVLLARFLCERREISAPAAVSIGRRISHELLAPDASSELAAEGLVLQLLAMGERETADPRRTTGWLSNVLETLRERTLQAPTLTELAVQAGVHPGHLARTFRRAYGVTVCQYSRNLRLEWAASQLAGDTPLAQIALDAGYSDQSHFTREFRRHLGVPPGRYRELLRR